MRVLPIADANGGLLTFPLAELKVQALMGYPASASRQAEFVLCNLVRNIATGPGKLEVSHAMLAALNGAPSDAEIAKRTEASATHGKIVGELLWLLLRMHESPIRFPGEDGRLGSPMPASLGRAIYLFCQRYATARDESGKQVPATRKSLLDLWKQYQDVAHLWAAYNFCGDKVESEMAATQRSRKMFLAFLALAESFRLFGISRRPGLGSKNSVKAAKPYLDRSTIWTAPPSLELTPPDLIALPLFGKWAELMKKYRVEERE